MKIYRLVTLLLIAIAFLTPALAIDANMDIFPSNNIVEPGEDFLVFGYIYANNNLDDSDVKIKIYDGDGDLIDTYTPKFYTLYEDDDRSGYFYKKIDISNTGDFEIKLKVEGNTEDIEDIEIKNMNAREVEIIDFDYDISGDEITFDIEVENKDDVDHEVKIYIQGEENFKNPKTFTIDVDKDDKEDIDKTYSLSDFGSGGNFIVVAQARTNSGEDESYSVSEYVFVDYEDYSYYDYYEYDFVYQSGNLVITDIELETSVFYPGDVIEGIVKVKNIGSQKGQYRFEYVVGNTVFKKGDVTFIEPGRTTEEEFFVEIPNENEFEFTARVISFSKTITTTEKFLVSSKIKLFSIYLEDDTFVTGANMTENITLTIRNRGNEDDSYTIDLDGWNNAEFTKMLDILAEQSKEINISFNILEETRADAYPVSITVCNTNDSCKTELLDLVVNRPESEQSIISWNEEQDEKGFTKLDPIMYNMNLTNIGSDVKDYAIEIEGIEFDAEDFELDVDELKEIEFSVIPGNETEYTFNLTVIAEGKIIFEKELTIKKGGFSAISGMLVYDIEVGGVSFTALILLAVVGVVTLVWFSYRYLDKRMWTEKVLEYNKNYTQNQYLRK